MLGACPNCYKVFSRYGAPLSVRTVYEVMADHNFCTCCVNLRRHLRGNPKYEGTDYEPQPPEFEEDTEKAVK